MEQLIVLINLENLNAAFTEQKISLDEQLLALNQDRDYERIRRKDSIMLVQSVCSFVWDIRKLFFFEGKGKTDYWIAPAELEPEVPKKVDLTRLKKKQLKYENETLRNSYVIKP